MPTVAQRILDEVGWNASADLSEARLLEPAAGAGEFVVQAATRLVESYRQQGVEPKIRHLRARIMAFEIHRPAARAACRRLVRALLDLSVHPRTAVACSQAWIRVADYLLADPPETQFTHVVANPPYLRWNRIPVPLRTAYEAKFSRTLTGGDLYIPFLDKAMDELAIGGKCGFLCSDRWQYTAYAAAFRVKWLPQLSILSNSPIEAAEAYTRKVNAYPSILIALKRSRQTPPTPTRPTRRGRTLIERGCTIRVGPALGVTSAFVVEPESIDVEQNLLYPWVGSSEIREGNIHWRGRHVISLFSESGNLIDINDFPKLACHLYQFRERLENRYVVRNGAPWYRTIDRLRVTDWFRPKLLVPEIAKYPRIALDQSGLIPSHGVYAIFPPVNQVESIFDLLREGGLAKSLKGVAPQLKNGYTRCYKRFLSTIRV